VGGALGSKLGDDGGSSAAPVSTATKTATQPAPELATNALDVVALAKQVEPAVVTITTGTGAGSGMVLTADGEVLTNNHVIQGSRTVRVVVGGEKSARTADVIGTDPRNDLALLKIRDASGLPTVTLGSSADLQVGQDVVAIGNALALGATPTVTTGIVSALDRDVNQLSGLIQTDAAINPGNSGGPLFDAAGRVIGINTLKASDGGDADNLGFAIPIDKAKAVVQQLRSGTPAAPTGYLGVRSTDDPDGNGALIISVEQGSAAASAGLQAGDVIAAVDGTHLDGSAALGSAVQDHKPGDKLQLTIVRNGRSLTVTATLGQA
jgi:putative serine protease PepD